MAKLRLRAMERWRQLLLASAGLSAVALVFLGSAVRISHAQPQPSGSVSTQGRGEKPPRDQPGDLQVTVIGILVTPVDGNTTVDPRLANIKSQLRKLIPADHGFKLLDVRSDRLSAGQAVRCDLGKGRLALVTLMDPLDAEGKVRLHCQLSQEKKRPIASNVSSPLNQLFFCEYALDDGSKLLIGVGAR